MSWRAVPIGRGGIPGYWMNETSGVLRPVVHRYLAGVELSEEDVAVMRTYLRQWITAGAWESTPGEPDRVEELRRAVDGLDSRAAIAGWLERAAFLGIDPL
ncbi:MAG TPA: hypothetical protein VF731_01745 [Solirubrobacterales bacterium]